MESPLSKMGKAGGRAGESVWADWMFDDIKGSLLILRCGDGIVVIFLKNLLEMQAEIFMHEIYDIWYLLQNNWGGGVGKREWDYK